MHVSAYVSSTTANVAIHRRNDGKQPWRFERNRQSEGNRSRQRDGPSRSRKSKYGEGATTIRSQIAKVCTQTVPLLLLTKTYQEIMVTVTEEQEARVGLRKVNIPETRQTAHIATGIEGHSIMSCFATKHAPSPIEAEAVFAQIPQAVKDHPVDSNTALGISKIALLAGDYPPDGCVNFLRTQVPPVTLPSKTRDVPVCAPGGFFLHTKTDCDNFILFLDANMDAPHHVKWRDMTGEEQFEWHQAFQRAGKRPARLADTVGLRGTDLGRLHTRQEVVTAANLSNSLTKRRPAGHAVNNAHWPRPRVLNF